MTEPPSVARAEAERDLGLGSARGGGVGVVAFLGLSPGPLPIPLASWALALLPAQSVWGDGLPRPPPPADLLLQPDALPAGPVRARGAEEPLRPGHPAGLPGLSAGESLLPSRWFPSQKARTTVGLRQGAGQDGLCWSLEGSGRAGRPGGSLHVAQAAPFLLPSPRSYRTCVSMGT